MTDHTHATEHHPTYCEVDLSAIRHNLKRLGEYAGHGVRLMPAVKANAYGHGLVEVARAAVEAGATWLAVASPNEGLVLRHAGLAADILVLGMTPPLQAEAAVAHHLSLAVYDADLAEAYAAAGRALGRRARLHVKIDTGMARLGVPAEAGVAFTRAMQGLNGVHVEGLFTHFATADSADQTFAREQLGRFKEVLATLEAAGARPPLVHAANSAAILALPEAAFDMVRPGIALYGLDPSDEVPAPPDFRPALAWKSSVAQVKTLPPGRSVGYGRAYFTRGDEQIVTVPSGYADGLRRSAPNEALLAGRRVPVVGRVCMDQAMLDATGLPGVRPGDEVVWIGQQGQQAITAGEVARRWGTISHEVVCGIAARVPRTFVA
jgi:Alr-MurF fusion protein